MRNRHKIKCKNPVAKGRAPIAGKRKFIDYVPYTHLQDRMLEAFPYMHELEVSRFIQLIFHEITEHLHEKKHINIPYFGRFFVKPFKVYQIYKRDVWNGYAEWIKLDKPIDDWTPCFEPSPYIQHLSTHRYTTMERDITDVDITQQKHMSTTRKWDKFYLKFKKRDQALRECPYSLTTMGWAGYNYTRIIKEGLNDNETIRLTANDGEVYNIKDGIDGNFDEKFKECYEKTKFYMEEVAKRNIHNLTKRNALRKVWNTTYAKYLHTDRKADVDAVVLELSNKRKKFKNEGFFYILKFGYGFETGERRRVYSGYFFNNI